MSENNLAKIAITSSADSALSQALNRINLNFEGGRITKAGLASWLIQRAGADLDEHTIEEIRRAHFNQVAYLENLVKKLKSSDRDSLSTEEADTLQDMLGQGSKKRPKSARHSEAGA
jgi:hypothetical protein